jgi:hypothetical protein
MHGSAVRGIVESMNGARFVHDQLEEHGWDVLIADAHKVKGLAPLACKTDKIDARVLAQLSARDLAPEIWLPDPGIRRERELARFRLHLRHRTTLKNRIHARRSPSVTPCPDSDLFGHAGRKLLDRLAVTDPWRRNVDVSLALNRRPRAADRPTDRAAQAPGRRPPLHRLVGHRTGSGLDQRLHDRLRDRRHRPLRLAGQAVRLHRSVSAGQAVRCQRPPRPTVQALTQVPEQSAPRC